jgi:hypothetical protein
MSQMVAGKMQKYFPQEAYNEEPVPARQAPYGAAMNLLFYIDASFWNNRVLR